jgi:hypothetical protein
MVVMCVGGGGFAALMTGASGGCSFCGDSCGNAAIVCCGGIGTVYGEGAGLVGTLGSGCMTTNSSCTKLNVQTSGSPFVGDGVTIPGGPDFRPPNSGSAGVGVGIGVSVTVEGCYTFPNIL